MAKYSNKVVFFKHFHANDIECYYRQNSKFFALPGPGCDVVYRLRLLHEIDCLKLTRNDSAFYLHSNFSNVAKVLQNKKRYENVVDEKMERFFAGFVRNFSYK